MAGSLFHKKRETDSSLFPQFDDKVHPGTLSWPFRKNAVLLHLQKQGVKPLLVFGSPVLGLGSLFVNSLGKQTAACFPFAVSALKTV